MYGVDVLLIEASMVQACLVSNSRVKPPSQLAPKSSYYSARGYSTLVSSLRCSFALMEIRQPPEFAPMAKCAHSLGLSDEACQTVCRVPKTTQALRR